MKEATCLTCFGVFPENHLTETTVVGITLRDCPSCYGKQQKLNIEYRKKKFFRTKITDKRISLNSHSKPKVEKEQISKFCKQIDKLVFEGNKLSNSNLESIGLQFGIKRTGQTLRSYYYKYRV